MDPKQLLEDGIRKELVDVISRTLNEVVVFPAKKVGGESGRLIGYFVSLFVDIFEDFVCLFSWAFNFLKTFLFKFFIFLQVNLTPTSLPSNLQNNPKLPHSPPSKNSNLSSTPSPSAWMGCSDLSSMSRTMPASTASRYGRRSSRAS